MVFTYTNIFTCMVAGSALTHDNVTGDSLLTTKQFHT